MHFFTVRYQCSTLIFFFFFYCRSTANWQQTVEAGLLFPAFQIMTSRTGWLTLAIGGTTVKFPLEGHRGPLETLTWSHQHFGWSEEANLRSRVVTTLVTLLCYRPQVTVWLDKHSDLKSQVMATLEMARSGPVIGVWEVVRFNMADSTSQQTGFNRLIAVEASKVLTRSASGVTGILGMERWWWLEEEEVAVHVLIMGLGSQRLALLLSLKMVVVQLNMTLVMMVSNITLHPSPTRWTYGSVKTL